VQFKKNAYTVVNSFSGELVKLVPPDVILRLKCTKFDFHRGSATDPAAGAYSAPPDPLAVFKRGYF